MFHGVPVMCCCCVRRHANAQPTNTGMQQEMKALSGRLKVLHDLESRLDEAISSAALTLRTDMEQSGKTGHSYVSQDEVRAIPSLQSQTVIALRGPPGTTLEVPGPFPHRSVVPFASLHAHTVDICVHMRVWHVCDDRS